MQRVLSGSRNFSSATHRLCATANNSQKKNIIVIGGSYVGTKSTEALAQRMYETHRVILIEQNTHFQHLFCFPRVAVVPGHERMAFIPFTDMFSKLPVDSTAVVQAVVTGVLPDSVVLDGGDAIPYDFLVLATGTKLRPPATLHSFDKQSGVAYFQQHQQRVSASQSIIVIGGGAVGVQLATDIKDFYPSKRVTLIHSRDRLMNNFSPKIHEVIMERMAELDITVLLGERVQIPKDGFPVDRKESSVLLNSGRELNADFVVLATGQVLRSDLIKTLSPLSITPTGFIAVRPTLQIADERFPHVFAAGDVANTNQQKSARHGHHHVDVVVENIDALARGQIPVKIYEDQLKGIRMSLGKTRDLGFWDGPDPSFQMSEDGNEEMRMFSLWETAAPGNTDYDS